MILAGVMGWPIGHSRSPLLHGHWLRRHGIDGAYLPFPVPPDRLAQALRALPALGIAGVNLTVPHKEAACRIVDEVRPSAAARGSVNMVTVLPDGRLEGASTDGEGFLAGLAEAAPDWTPESGPALLIGAGGAARAIAVALLGAGVDRIRVVNRSEARAERLAADLGHAVECWPWSCRQMALDSVGLVVNATSLGMQGQPPLDLDLGLLCREAVVVDIVYVPLETPLLAAARARGNRGIDGLGMLLHQARPAFARWFGVEPVVDRALREAVLRG
jgi:shikimate dehydrogenase